MSFEKFLKEYRTPENYHPKDLSSNRGHEHEK
ncbi:hypothetical protein DVR12_17670 [Chitinophaga silvatica]|uniref:Toxin YqcG C-terminal domain-containing protein n=1 Tax=Chitinophaga silvatica TaxID=2282649 RepID=A0A3E1Y874_9BACT|nr:hypothetical protein DVR12_17670 [Chitinophaga silvatica]